MKTFHRAIVFSKIPLNSVFRYRNVFQLFPASLTNMPYYSGQRHYPLILEYWTTDEDNVTIEHEFKELSDMYSDTARTLNKQDKILSLLTLISNYRFFRYTEMDGNWAIPVWGEKVPREEMNKWSSKWCIPWFWFPGLPEQLRITEMTVTSLPPTNLVPHLEYYTNDPNLDLDTKRSISFPKTITAILDAYFSLDRIAMAVVDSALSFIVSAVEIRRSRSTLALLAAFTAVETMMNWEFKDHIAEKCDTCGQLKYSIARKFREYLLSYIGDSEANKRKFNAYYSLRSKITHTGHLLKSEYLFSEVARSDRDKDYATSIDVLQLGRLSITNWLLLHNTKQQTK